MERGFLDAERLAAERRRGIWRGRVLTDYLDELVATRPDDTALVAFREEERTTTRLTYRELASRAARVARALHRLGVRRGDVVSFQLPNWWEFVAVHLACVRLGAASNPLMPIFRHRELAFMLRHADSRVFIAPARFRGFDHGALARQLARELPGLARVLLVGETASIRSRRASRPQRATLSRVARARAGRRHRSCCTPPAPPASRRACCTPPTPCSARCATFADRMQLGAGRRDLHALAARRTSSASATACMMSLMLGIPLVLTDIWNAASARCELIERARRAPSPSRATPFLADLADCPSVERRGRRGCACSRAPARRSRRRSWRPRARGSASRSPPAGA